MHFKFLLTIALDHSKKLNRWLSVSKSPHDLRMEAIGIIQKQYPEINLLDPSIVITIRPEAISIFHSCDHTVIEVWQQIK